MRKNNKILAAIASMSGLVLTGILLTSYLKNNPLSNLFAINSNNLGNYRLCLYGETSHTHSVPPYSNMQITQAEVNAGQFTRNTDNNNPINFTLSKTNCVYDPDGDLLGLKTNGYIYNTTPLNGIYKIDYRWKQYDMYIDFGYEPITYSVSEMGDEDHLPSTVVKRVKISGNPSDRGAKTGLFDSTSFFADEDFNYIRFQSCDSDGGTNWLKGIDIYYSCTAVQHFVHKDKIEPFHNNAGMLEHYVGSDGNYYDLEKNVVSYESLVIPTKTKQYVAGQADFYNLSKAYLPGETFVFDVDLQGSNQIQFTMYQNSWSSRRTNNCLVYADGTNNKPSFVKSHLLDDGWVRVEIDLSNVVSNESYWTDNDRFDMLNQLTNFYINNGTGTGIGTGYFELEVNPKLGHSYGEFVQEVAPLRGVDGRMGYYQCSDCGLYFDEDYHYISNNISDLTITANQMINGANTGTLYPLSHTYYPGEILYVDVKISDDSVGDKFSFTLYAKSWQARCKNICIWTAYKTFADNASESAKYVTMYDTEDGFIRFAIDLAKMDSGCWTDGDPSDYGKFTHFFANSAAGVKAQVELEPKGGNVYRGTHQAKGTEQQFVNFTPATMDMIMNIDIHFVEEGTVAINLMEGWGSAGKMIYLRSDGFVLNQSGGIENITGVLVYKVHDVEGYVGNYYRLRINLSMYNIYGRSIIDRVCTEGQTTAITYMHVLPDEDIFVADPFVMLPNNTAHACFSLFNPVTVADNDGLLAHKNLTFNVKGVGSGNVSFTFMEGTTGWGNMSKMHITFENNKVTRAWLTSLRTVEASFVNNSDGSATITVDNKLLPGDGIIGNKDGATGKVIGNIRTDVFDSTIQCSINLESLKLVNNGSHTGTHQDYVDAHRQNDGNIEYTYCNECEHYFDKDGTKISQSETVIPNRYFEFGQDTTNTTIDLPQSYSISNDFVIDFYLNPTVDTTKIAVAIGDETGNNYLGYFYMITNNNSDAKLEGNVIGVKTDIVDDGYTRLTISPQEVINSASSMVHGSLNHINRIFVRTADSKASGGFEWMPSSGKILGQRFTANNNLDLKFDNISTAGLKINLEITFETGADTHLNVSLLNTPNWDNYFGYFSLSLNGNSDTGITYTKLDDKTIRFVLDVSQLIKVNGSRDGLSTINEIYVRGGWTNASGFIKYSLITPSADSPVIGDIY